MTIIVTFFYSKFYKTRPKCSYQNPTLRIQAVYNYYFHKSPVLWVIISLNIKTDLFNWYFGIPYVAHYFRVLNIILTSNVSFHFIFGQIKLLVLLLTLIRSLVIHLNLRCGL